MNVSFLRATLVAGMLLLSSMPAMAQYADAERLRIHGSNTLGANLVPVLVQAWMKSIGYEDIERIERGASMTEVRGIRDGAPLVVEVAKHGSAAGMAAIVAGNAEVAMMARTPNAQEVEAAWQLGDLRSPEQEFVVALDGILVLVHRDNPVRALGIEQLRGIYSGRITNWAQLGGVDAPIRVITPSAGGDRDMLRDRVLAGELITGARIERLPTQVASAVSGDRNAIGIAGLRSQVGPLVRPLAVSDGGEALFPTRLNILSEDYPLVRRYSLYGGQMMSALGRSFALFSVGREAQLAVARAGHIAVTLRPATQQPVRGRQRDYVSLITGAERLPLSLRFNRGGLQSMFDSRAQYDLDRIVAFMRLPQNAGRQAMVVAFGAKDPGGSIVSTLVTSDRANVVADYLQQRGIVVRRSVGLGAMRPLVAFANPAAAFINDRVEIWIN